MEMIKVKKQIIKDNVFEGFRIIDASVELAEEQLSLPKEERHPHWKSVEYATAEDVELWGGLKKDDKKEVKPKAKVAKEKEPKTV